MLGRLVSGILFCWDVGVSSVFLKYMCCLVLLSIFLLFDFNDAFGLLVLALRLVLYLWLLSLYIWLAPAVVPFILQQCL